MVGGEINLDDRNFLIHVIAAIIMMEVLYYVTAYHHEGGPLLRHRLSS